MKPGIYRLAAALLTIALAACGGGGTSTATPPTSSGSSAPNAPSSSQAITFQAVIIFPSLSSPTSSAVARNGTRHPLFISPSTAGATLNVFQHGNDTGTPVSSNVDNVSTGSSLCVTGTSGARTCSIPINVPAGNYDFVLATFDTAPVNGAIPPSAHQLAISMLTQQISLNANNAVTFLLSGIVSSVGLSSAAGGTLSYASLPADGAAHSFGILVTADDADGNPITGPVPYASPIPVTLAETGGSGHTQFVLDGVNVGTSATIAKATDTLALVYDGAGTPGYSTTTVVAGTNSVVVSPMYVTPGTFTIAKLSNSTTGAISEASAPTSIAYAASTTCADVNSSSVSGSGSSATLNIGSTAPGGFASACNVTVKDVLGTQLTLPVTFAIPGPITAGTPTGASTGTCASSVQFTAAAQTTTIPLSDPGFGGTIAVGDSATSVATAVIAGSSVTVTAQSAGTTTLTFADAAGNTMTCSIGVTTTSGSAQ